MLRQDVIELVEKEKIIVVIRGIPEEKLLNCVKALYDGGIRLVEVAFDSKGKPSNEETARAIALLAKQFQDICVGAGTVLTSAQVRLAAGSGAKYIVSPNTNALVISVSRENELVSIPGALTPTEICMAERLGADFVKIFPAGCMGTQYFAAISAPLGGTRLLAVGGIELEDIPAYMSSGVMGFGISTKILKPSLVERGDYAAITELAKKYVDAVSQKA